MSAAQMLGTSLLLGMFVLLGGCYGLLYCLGRLRASRRLVRAAATAYLLQGVATGLLALSSLDLWWKVLLLASFLAFVAIPPLTWRFLERLHEPQEQHS
jgi:hypothetical protein